MGTNRTWKGGAKAEQQIVTLTVEATPSNGETFIIQLEHPSGSPQDLVTIASYTAVVAGDTGATVASALYYLLTTGSTSGSTGAGGANSSAYLHEYNTRISWSYTAATAILTATARYAGEPFLMTVSTGTGTITKVNTKENRGPNDFSDAGNFVEGVVPVADDDVFLTGSHSVLYGCNQGTTIDSIMCQNYSGSFGTRAAPMHISPTDEVIVDSPSGSFHMRMTTGTCAKVVVNACRESTFGKFGSGDYTTIEVRTGAPCTIGFDRATSPTVAAVINMGGDIEAYRPSLFTSVYSFGGTTYLYDNAGTGSTTMQIDGGEVTLDGVYSPSGAIILNGGVLNHDSSGTLSGGITANGGLYDPIRNRKTKAATITQQGGTVRADSAYVTLTWTRVGPTETKSLAPTYTLGGASGGKGGGTGNRV